MKKRGIFLIIACITLLMGCGPKQDPKVAVEEALTGIKNGNSEVIQKYFGEQTSYLTFEKEISGLSEDMGVAVDAERLQKDLLQNLTFTIEEPRVEDKTKRVFVDVTLANVNLIEAVLYGMEATLQYGVAHPEIYIVAGEEEEKRTLEVLENIYVEKIFEYLEGKDTPKGEHKVSLELLQEKDSYRIMETEALTDGIFGGAARASESAVQKMNALESTYMGKLNEAMAEYLRR